MFILYHEVHLLWHKSKCFQLNVRLLIFAFSTYCITKSNPPSHMIWVQHYETRPQQQRSHCPGLGWLCSNCPRHLQVKIAKSCHEDSDHQRNKYGISNQMINWNSSVHVYVCLQVIWFSLFFKTLNFSVVNIKTPLTCTRGYQKVHRLMQWNQQLLRYAYKFCWK